MHPLRPRRRIHARSVVALSALTCLALLAGTKSAEARRPGTLALKPNCGAEQIDRIQASGSGFDPTADVDIYFDGQHVAATQADGNGDFPPVTFDTPSVPAAGAHAVTTMVRYDVDNPADSGPSATYVVPCGTQPTASPGGPPPPPTQNGAATLTLSPTVLPTGFVTAARGTHFQGVSAITFLWLLPNGGVQPATCRAVASDDRGSFQTSCLVLPHDVLGVRLLKAADVAGDEATATALVVLPPVEPSASGLLARR